jgi:hypothetical protein
MDKVYQVFVSSTYSDLRDERRDVSETLAKAGYVPAGMELFPATDQQQLDFIKRVIDRCDYYVVIIGGRYGSLADDSVSYTEKEYEYALEKKMPVLAFLHGNPDAIAVGKTDQDFDKASKLKAFRDRLSRGRMIDYWTEPYELCTKIVVAVGQAVNLTPGVGWIRGDQAIDPKVLQELEKLRIENANLVNRIKELDTDNITFPSHLVGPNDSLPIEVDLEHLGDTNIYGQKEVLSVEELEVTANLGSLFEQLFDTLLTEPSESSLAAAIGNAVLLLAERKTENVRGKVSESTVVVLRFHFEALGLIRASGREYSRNYNYIAWEITDKGRRFVTNKRAIHKLSNDDDSARSPDGAQRNPGTG